MQTVKKLRPVAVSERAVIKIDTHEHRVTERAVTALATHPDIYQRAGALVQVVNESRATKNVTREAGVPSIALLPLARLRELLSEVADFQAFKEKSKEPGYVSVHVPDWCTRQVDARGQWKGIRHLEAVSETPILRPDGTVLDKPGYDPATGVLFQPRVTFPDVPQHPDRDAAHAALETLLDPLVDFPFAKPEHQAAAVAGILTPLARYAFPGPAPLVSIDKNVHGAGGSLLADTIATAATGRAMARMSQTKDDDEERKRILSIALAGDRMVLLDNLDRPLGGAALDSALTGTEWRDRILGQSEMRTAPLLACWFATGNNIQVQRDTLRRVLPIRIESSDEHPEERTGFRYDPLLPAVATLHPRLAVAALTLLKAYALAGSPNMHLKPWGSFEGWSNLVRAALVWAGAADPALARQELASLADTEANALRILLDNWQLLDATGTGVTAAAILNRHDDEHSEEHDAVREALAELAPSTNGKPVSARSLGKRLAALKGRVVGGKALDCRSGKFGQVWIVRTVR